MNLRRALFIAVVAAPSAVAPAAAQLQGGAPGQASPCVKQFIELREAAAKKAHAIQLASKHHVRPKEACRLFNSFSAAEAKMVKFASANGVWCGIPEQAMNGMKKAHARTLKIRARVCRVAAAPPRPRGPTLSDTLAPVVPDAANSKSGDTFSTLTGSPLSAK